MNGQKGVNTHSTQPHRPENPEEGGIPTQKKTGRWLSHKIQTWKIRTTRFLRKHGVLPDKSIARRGAQSKVDETKPDSIIIDMEGIHPALQATKEPPPAFLTDEPLPASSPMKTETPCDSQSATSIPPEMQEYFLNYPCEFALRCIEDELDIPEDFVEKSLRPGLQWQWNKTAGISPEQASTITDLLIRSFGIEGMDVNEQFLDSYQDKSRFAPLSPEQKFSLLLKFSEQLKQPQVQQNFEKILNTLSYYDELLSTEKLDKNDYQDAMGNLAEYLIDNAHDLPSLTEQQLAACSHFSKYIQSMQQEVKDVPGEMARFIRHITLNSKVFTSSRSSPAAIAAGYILDAEFEDEKAHLRDEILSPTVVRKNSDE